MQSLQRGSLNTELCRWAERHRSFPFFQLREKRRLSIRKPMRQFAAAQAGRRITPGICQKNLPLRFQLCHRWQHCVEDFAYWRQVICRDPVRQFDQLRRQRGNKIQHAGDFADFRFWRRGLRKFDNDANH